MTSQTTSSWSHDNLIFAEHAQNPRLSSQEV